jgi:hypothetical protein
MLSHLVAALEGVVSGVGKEVGSRARFLSVVELPDKTRQKRVLPENSGNSVRLFYIGQTPHVSRQISHFHGPVSGFDHNILWRHILRVVDSKVHRHLFSHEGLHYFRGVGGFCTPTAIRITQRHSPRSPTFIYESARA